MTAARFRWAGITLVAFAFASLAIVFGTGRGVAQDDGPGEDEALATDISVYATGLNNPRGLDFDMEGDLWVAEAGRGPGEIGPDTIVVPDSEDPATGGSFYVGFTGAFSEIVDGKVERIFDGLPSIAGEDGLGAIGPSDVSVHHDGTGRGVTGLFADPAERDALVPDAKAGFLGVVDSNAEITLEVDIAAFEGEFNPDNGAIESNPNGVLAADNGGTYVVDASGNALLYVDAEGNISVTSVFIPRLVETPEFLPQPPFPPEVPMQAVPTSATYGPDGAIYVAELTGFPFPEGEAMIWRVEPGEPATEYLTGFTNIIDIAFDGDGNLYVLEIDSNGIDTEPQFNGSLWRVPADGGDRELIAGSDDLFAPGGVTIGPDGALYVTNNSVLADEGQVLRIEVAPAAPEGKPTGTPEAGTPSPAGTPEGTETPAPTGTPEATATAMPTGTAAPEATATMAPEPAGTPEATPTEPTGGGAVNLSLSADNIQFSTDTLTAPAGADVTLEFTNEEAVPHNFALYDSPSMGEELFSGDIITGPDATTNYEFTAPETPGEYYFLCEIHPAQMNGTFVVE